MGACFFKAYTISACLISSTRQPSTEVIGFCRW